MTVCCFLKLRVNAQHGTKHLISWRRNFSETIAQHGPDSVAFYVSGQLLTEDYYVANKLMKGFIGSANIDTNSRLCMASSVAGHKRAFGADVVPGNYEDLELADLVVLIGSNLAWCHPVLFQRLMAAKEKRGTKIVVIDPRRTATAEFADLHLAIKPGSDVALFNGLLVYLHNHGKTNQTICFRAYIRTRRMLWPMRGSVMLQRQQAFRNQNLKIFIASLRIRNARSPSGRRV